MPGRRQGPLPESRQGGTGTPFGADVTTAIHTTSGCLVISNKRASAEAVCCGSLGSYGQVSWSRAIRAEGHDLCAVEVPGQGFPELAIAADIPEDDRAVAAAGG
jgi:hypothetical protein